MTIQKKYRVEKRVTFARNVWENRGNLKKGLSSGYRKHVYNLLQSIVYSKFFLVNWWWIFSAFFFVHFAWIVWWTWCCGAKQWNFFRIIVYKFFFDDSLLQSQTWQPRFVLALIPLYCYLNLTHSYTFFLIYYSKHLFWMCMMQRCRVCIFIGSTMISILMIDGQFHSFKK